MREKIDFIKELIELAEQKELSELSVDFKGIKVAIKKTAEPQYVYPPMSSIQQTAAPLSNISAHAEQEAAPGKDEVPSHYVAVTSPLSGVFYRSPKPGSPSFVNLGDMVEKDQPLCIVEAMKIMNEITSDIKGKVAKICLENAEVANQGEVLMYLEPM